MNKEERKIYYKKWRKNNKEKVNLYSKKYRQKNKDKITDYFRQYRNKNREKMREYNRLYNMVWRKKNGYHNETKWRKKNKKKYIAQYTFHQSVEKGEIKKENCKKCGNKKVHAHHPNYSEPLKVIWLCPLHHKEIHKKFMPQFIKTETEFEYLSNPKNFPVRQYEMKCKLCIDKLCQYI